MNVITLQSSPEITVQGGSPGIAVWGLLLMGIPVLMVIIGMVMGFQALRDIRMAEGRLGGAMCATLAAGFLPAMAIGIACGGGMVMLMEEVMPRDRPRSGSWPVLGSLVGIWLSFLMMRGMYRQATGWMRPVGEERRAEASGVTNAAVILTIVGGALMLLLLAASPSYRILNMRRENVLLLNLGVLVAGMVCGVVGRREAAARTCAWISGSLFVIMLFLLAA